MSLDYLKPHAAQMERDKKCPHCQQVISMSDLLCMVRGSGFRSYVLCKVADGRLAFVSETLVNPQNMDILDQAQDGDGHVEFMIHHDGTETEFPKVDK